MSVVFSNGSEQWVPNESNTVPLYFVAIFVLRKDIQLTSALDGLITDRVVQAKI